MFFEISERTRMIQEQIEKMASAGDKALDSKAVAGVTDLSKQAGGATAKDAVPFDVGKFAGIFAAIGLALGAIGTAVASILSGFMELRLWQIPLAVLGLLLVISGPSMVIAYLKLRRQFWPDKQRASLYLPPHKLPTYRFLLERIYKMDHKKLQKYWTRKLFSGDIPAKPSSVPSEAAAGRLVAKDPGALSVVDASEIPEGVKVLRIDGKVPGEEGYPLGTDE